VLAYSASAASNDHASRSVRLTHSASNGREADGPVAAENAEYALCSSYIPIEKSSWFVYGSLSAGGGGTGAGECRASGREVKVSINWRGGLGGVITIPVTLMD
jgi:hypothetical protein